jgi:DNA-binding NarL/FixJ family response regulator
LVVDIRLGAFNGLQLALDARRRYPEARIVMISSWDDPVLRRDAEQFGATYVVKPFSAADLLAAIDRSPIIAGQAT